MSRDQLTPLDYCDGHRGKSNTTVNGICMSCAEHVLRQRRALFSRSEGNDYMRRRFGYKGNFFNLEVVKRGQARVRGSSSQTAR